MTIYAIVFGISIILFFAHMNYKQQVLAYADYLSRSYQAYGITCNVNNGATVGLWRDGGQYPEIDCGSIL